MVPGRACSMKAKSSAAMIGGGARSTFASPTTSVATAARTRGRRGRIDRSRVAAPVLESDADVVGLTGALDDLVDATVEQKSASPA